MLGVVLCLVSLRFGLDVARGASRKPALEKPSP
jgi:hypothetical protein